MNTIEFVKLPAMMFPDREILIYEGKRFDYDQLHTRIGQLASGLAKLGVSRGDVVAILQTNCNEYVELYYACAILGAIFVPVNYRARRDELHHMLTDSDSRYIFVGARYFDEVEKMRPELPNIKEYIAIEHRHPNMRFYDDVLGEGDPDEADALEYDAAESDLSVIMYTSGTTALPKGVMLTYGGFIEYVFNQTELASEESVGANLVAAPFYHIAGFGTMMTALYGGRKLVIQRQFEAGEWLRLVEEEKITNAFLVPTMLKMVLEHEDFGKRDLSSLRVLSYGGAPMPVPVIMRAIERFPKTVSFMNAFGQTETTSTVTLLGPDDHRLEGTPEEIEKKIIRLGSIGQPVGDTVLMIFDENGEPLPPGEVGEIGILVPRAMSGYWKQEEATAQTIVDGWIRTRDMGWMDEDGYVFLAGRKSDMIIRGGENIAPEQIEGVIHTHPKVEDVAVIGVPSEEWGETVKAVVVPKPGEQISAEEIIAYCKERMASFKAPESVEFMTELPRNPMGKLLKNVLRDRHRQQAATTG